MPPSHSPRVNKLAVVQDSTVVVLDVGGTNTRIALLRWDDNALRLCSTIRREPVSTRGKLLDLVATILIEHGSPIVSACVAAVAGPAKSDDSVTVTNWLKESRLRKQDFEEAVGQPLQFRLLNDMEAAATGLASLAVSRAKRQDVVSLRGERHQDLFNGTMCLLCPGTGLGFSALLDVRSLSTAESFLVVSTEGQHCQAPCPSGMMPAYKWISEYVLGGKAPSWEDIVSGRGLESLYRAASPRMLELPASAIAERAALDSDSGAIKALTYYYRVAAAFAQQMALTFSPTGGVFLGGTSTRKNRELLGSLPFSEWFDDNQKQQRMLRTFPLSMLYSEVVLNGAIAYAMNPNLVLFQGRH